MGHTPETRIRAYLKVKEWLKLRSEGLSNNKIAHKYGYYQSTVMRNIRKFLSRSSSSGRAFAL